MCTALLSIAAIALAAPALRSQTAADAQSRLWDAAIAGDTTALARAVADGARVDSLDLRTNPRGRRALNWAAWNDRTTAITWLIAHGATVNVANLTGYTPLHHAAEAGALGAARTLLAAGADALWPTDGGELPADVARRMSHAEIAVAIDSAVARPAKPR